MPVASWTGMPSPAARHGSSAWTLRGLLLGLALGGSACGEREPELPAQKWPTGTVLLIAGRPVTAEAVDPLAEALLELEPAASLTHRRRLALLHLTVPLECARGLADEQRRLRAEEEARAFAESVADTARATLGPVHLPGLEPRQGDFRELGIPLWHVARELEIGGWSGVHELPGAFVVVKLVGSVDARRGVERRLELLEARFPYLDGPERLDYEVARAQVLPIDPTWEPAVPGLLQYRERTSFPTPAGSSR